MYYTTRSTSAERRTCCALYTIYVYVHTCAPVPLYHVPTVIKMIVTMMMAIMMMIVRRRSAATALLHFGQQRVLHSVCLFSSTKQFPAWLDHLAKGDHDLSVLLEIAHFR